MTPAIQLARKAGIKYRIHEYQHDADHPSYGLEAAEKMGVSADRVFKTLVVISHSGQLAVGVLPVVAQLSMKRMARALDAKKVEMAPAAEVQRATGYVLGGVSPLGQKKRLPTFIDQSAQGLTTLFVSAGRRGLEIEVAPTDLSRLIGARFDTICL